MTTDQILHVIYMCATISFAVTGVLACETLIAGTIDAFGLRSAAIYWEWRLPAWFTTRPK